MYVMLCLKWLPRMLLLNSLTFETTNEVPNSVHDMNADEEGEDIILYYVRHFYFMKIDTHWYSFVTKSFVASSLLMKASLEFRRKHKHHLHELGRPLRKSSLEPKQITCTSFEIRYIDNDGSAAGRDKLCSRVEAGIRVSFVIADSC